MSFSADPLPQLQDIVDQARNQIFAAPAHLSVKRFGSRAYGAAGPRSDWDFYLELPPSEAVQSKVLRACIRQLLIDGHVTSWSKSGDQPENSTLKWSTLRGKQNVSINVSEEGKMQGALHATAFLTHYFEGHIALRDAAAAVSEKLRDEKQMSTDSPIGDTLKSTLFPVHSLA